MREKGLLGAAGYDPLKLIKISRFATKGRLAIVNYHGGNEYYWLLRPELKRISIIWQIWELI